jgi:SAM-dependent methyltransferase
VKALRPKLDGSEADFFRFVDEYWALIRRHIPGDFHYEYDSRIYMLPVHAHLERLISDLAPGSRVLDLGCGRGHYTAYLCERGLKAEGLEVRQPRPGDDFLHNQDKSVLKKYKALWAESQKRYGGKLGYFDGRKLPYKDSSLDAVLFYATFEHVPVEHIAFVASEAARVLKPGGRVYIYRCPSSWAWKERVTQYFGLGHHEKLYGKGEILGLLRGAGFEIESFSRSDFFPAHVVPAQKLLNRLSPALLLVEKALQWTPLAYFFHHFEIRALKKR